MITEPRKANLKNYRLPLKPVVRTLLRVFATLRETVLENQNLLPQKGTKGTKVNLQKYSGMKGIKA